MASIKQWIRVPDKSILELSATADSAQFTSSARIVDDDGNEEQLDHGDISPGPHTVKIRSPKQYSVRIRIAFTGPQQTTAVLDASITKPDGTTHGTAFQLEAEGKNGDIARGDIFISTAGN